MKQAGDSPPARRQPQRKSPLPEPNVETDASTIGTRRLVYLLPVEVSSRYCIRHPRMGRLRYDPDVEW
jgi:hypothetical protein